MKKRAQTSVFVVAGLSLIIILAIILFTQNTVDEQALKEEASAIQSFSEIRDKVKKYTEDCLEIVTQEIIDKLWVTDAGDIDKYIDEPIQRDGTIECTSRAKDRYQTTRPVGPTSKATILFERERNHRLCLPQKLWHQVYPMPSCAQILQRIYLENIE